MNFSVGPHQLTRRIGQTSRIINGKINKGRASDHALQFEEVQNYMQCLCILRVIWFLLRKLTSPISSFPPGFDLIRPTIWLSMASNCVSRSSSTFPELLPETPPEETIGNC